LSFAVIYQSVAVYIMFSAVSLLTVDFLVHCSYYFYLTSVDEITLLLFMKEMSYSKVFFQR